MKHTPGPWKRSTRSPLTIVSGRVFGDVAEVVQYDDNREEGEANARRIVHCVNTYDDLLEALKVLLERCESYNLIDTHHAQMEIARAAIAKAEGTDT